MSVEENKLKYLPKKRVANVLAALLIIWTLALWTWIVVKIMEGDISIAVSDDGSLLVALNPAIAIVTSILAMLNVALGIALKHLMDSANSD